MNKKGFTLIELLAVLVIIAGISLVSVSSMINMSKKNEEKTEVYDTIYMATEAYIYNNYSDYEVLDSKGAVVLVSVIDLMNDNYLNNNLKNPKDDSKFTTLDYVQVTRNDDMTLSFVLLDK